MNLYELTMQQAHRLLSEKEVSSQELTAAVIDRIKTVDEKQMHTLRWQKKQRWKRPGWLIKLFPRGILYR